MSNGDAAARKRSLRDAPGPDPVLLIPAPVNAAAPEHQNTRTYTHSGPSNVIEDVSCK